MPVLLAGPKGLILATRYLSLSSGGKLTTTRTERGHQLDWGEIRTYAEADIMSHFPLAAVTEKENSWNRPELKESPASHGIKAQFQTSNQPNFELLDQQGVATSTGAVLSRKNLLIINELRVCSKGPWRWTMLQSFHALPLFLMGANITFQGMTSKARSKTFRRIKTPAISR